MKICNIQCFRYDDKYHLILSSLEAKAGIRKVASSVKSVANFIDVNGSVVQELVESEVTKLHNSICDKKDK